MHQQKQCNQRGVDVPLHHPQWHRRLSQLPPAAGCLVPPHHPRHHCHLQQQRRYVHQREEQHPLYFLVVYMWQEKSGTFLLTAGHPCISKSGYAFSTAKGLMKDIMKGQRRPSFGWCKSFHMAKEDTWVQVTALAIHLLNAGPVIHLPSHPHILHQNQHR